MLIRGTVLDLWCKQSGKENDGANGEKGGRKHIESNKEPPPIASALSGNYSFIQQVCLPYTTGQVTKSSLEI